MKKTFLAVLSFALLSAPAILAHAEDKVVSVSFASVAALQAKNGERLDPKLFHFGRAVGGNEDSSRVSANGFHKSKEAACRWALLGGFLKFQHKARNSNTQVVGINTYAGTAESSKAGQCLCLAGGFVVRSTIKASYK